MKIQLPIEFTIKTEHTTEKAKQKLFLGTPLKQTFLLQTGKKDFAVVLRVSEDCFELARLKRGRGRGSWPSLFHVEIRSIEKETHFLFTPMLTWIEMLLYIFAPIVFLLFMILDADNIATVIFDIQALLLLFGLFFPAMMALNYQSERVKLTNLLSEILK